MIDGAAAIGAVANHAVKVDPGASPTTYVLIVICGIISAVAVTWAKDRPKMFELFSTRRKDMDAGLAQRVADLESRVDKAVNDAHVAQMQVTTLNAAFQLVAGELHRQDPDNPTLRLAREMIAAAATTDNGFNAGMGKVVNRLAQID